VRVVAIGLDAAEWWYLEHLIEQGDMPAIGSLLERSRHGLIDAAEARNEYVWAEFVNGGDPGPPYDWDIHRFEPATYAAFLRDAQPAPRFWSGHTRGRVVTLDVPRVTAADDGVHVVGWGAAQVYSPRSSNPPGLLREIDARFGPHPMVRNDQIGWHHARRINLVCEEIEHGARVRASVARYLLERFPDWEFFATVWSEMHPAAEFLWHGVDREHLLAGHRLAGLAGERLRGIFRAVDAGVGELVATLPDDVAVVVFSLNGVASGPGDTSSGVLLPEFMAKFYAKTSLLQNDVERWRAHDYAPVEPGPCQRGGYFTQHRVDAPAKARIAQKALARLPDAAWPVQDRLRRVVAKRMHRELGPLGMTIPPEADVTVASLEAERIEVNQVAAWYARLWPTMPAFALPSFAMGYVRVNLVGREADGAVTLDEYDAFCTDITNTLLKLTSPRTQEPVVQQVLRTRHTAAEVLDPHGPYADLVVVWTQSVDAIEHPETGVIGPFPIQRSATHTRHGFAMVVAPGVEPGDAGRHPGPDLPATILTLLGADVEHATFLDAATTATQ
jgi:predicted AlkP superfamily phosphohydrolase/phosphomutase